MAIPPGRRDARQQALAWLTALVGLGYFLVWTVFGIVVFPLGIALAGIEMQQPTLARTVPIATAVVVLIAGALPFTAWKARQLACYREVPGHGRTLPADAATAWRHGLRLRHPLQLRVCWSNGDPPRCRGHGSPGHGSRYGRNHCRTASTEWQTCRASYRGHRRSGRDVLDRDSNSRALMTRSLQFKSDTNSPRYMHVPNCAWTATLASWEGAGGETQA